jgi:hypothetical protein
MDGEANWVLMMVIAFGAVGLVAMVAYSKAVFERFKSRDTELACPETGTAFAGVIEKDLATGETKVVGCARFEDPSKVTCQQGCLHERP